MIYERLPNGTLRARIQIPVGIMPDSLGLRTQLGSSALEFDIQQPPGGFRVGAEEGTFDVPFGPQLYRGTLPTLPAYISLARVTQTPRPIQALVDTPQFSGSVANDSELRMTSSPHQTLQSEEDVRKAAIRAEKARMDAEHAAKKRAEELQIRQCEEEKHQ